MSKSLRTQAQELAMLQQAISNAVRSFGDGLSSVARK